MNSDNEDVSFGLTANRMNTRSMNRENTPQKDQRYQPKQRSGGPSGGYKKPGGGYEKSGGYERSGGYAKKEGYVRSDSNKDPSDIPFVQCDACGTPGHKWQDCNHKNRFIRLNEWYAQLAPSQRKEMSNELDKSARATHERYKKAYKNRREVRNRVNKADVDPESREILLSAYRGQIDGLDYGSLDPDLVDDDEPFLSFDPETDRLTE